MEEALGRRRVLNFVVVRTFVHAIAVLRQSRHDFLLGRSQQPDTHAPKVSIYNTFPVMLWEEVKLGRLQLELRQHL